MKIACIGQEFSNHSIIRIYKTSYPLDQPPVENYVKYKEITQKLSLNYLNLQDLSDKFYILSISLIESNHRMKI